jgi:chromosome segregation protein
LRIKKLELVGFKSFKDRTVIQFDSGITGIVGPNGCGKSNIVDALVWVMGEMSAKHLRGSSMEDVIFAGAENYAPMGMAEVSLTLENDGGPFPVKYAQFSELMITRRLHRNGESDYLINKEPARLKDIHEIFMDTGAGSKGFSIIEQGAIGKIITAKPEDRRVLIEEAAGITKFKVRKKESQRKLQATDQNLVRLQDITGELKRQIDSLQRQAQRAERYRNLKKQIEDLDLWISSIHYKDLFAQAQLAETHFQEAQSHDINGGVDFQKWQAELEERRLQLLEQEKEIHQNEEIFHELQSQVRKREMDLQELRFEIEQAKRNEQMTGTLLHEQKAREELLLRDHSEHIAQKSKLTAEVTALKAEFEEKNTVFEEINQRLTEVDDELTSQRREMFVMGQTLSAVEAKISSLIQQIEDIESRKQHQESVLVELREKQIEFEERKVLVSAEFEAEKIKIQEILISEKSLSEQKNNAVQSQNEKYQEVETFKDHLNEVTSRLYGLESLQGNFEGFEDGVKSVMLWQKTKAEQLHADGSVSTHFYPVSELVEVPSEFEIAMEAVLGTKLQTLVTENKNHSLEALSHLKDKKAGRSSFLSHDVIASESSSKAPPQGVGVKAVLHQVIQCREGFKPSIEKLLGDVIVVESIAEALQLRARHPDWSYVTMDGDVLTREGLLTGGSSEAADSGVLKRRREIKELSQKKGEWAGKLALAQAALKKIEAEVLTLTQDLEKTQKLRQEQEIKVTGLKKDFERAQTEINNAQYAVERQDREVQKIIQQYDLLESKKSELYESAEINRAKKTELEESIQGLDEELNSQKLGYEGLQNDVLELKVKLASRNQEFEGSNKHLGMIERSLGELQAQLSRMSEESSKNTSFLSSNQLSFEENKLMLDRMIITVEDGRAKLSELRNSYEIFNGEARDLEDKVINWQRQKNSLQMKMNDAKLQFEQARMKEQYLVDQIRERYMIELPDVVARYEEREGDPKSAEIELKELREKISKIGEVNLSAIEEYEECSKRYEFLSQQQHDLTEAKEQLRKVIEKINKICSKRFKETFELVNERFVKVFPVLFGGGEARLELHEDSETQEMGIEISAKPPGKKMQSVTLMSGGEKALTAVALIFAIFLVKPSPYCLLDEVDAPLDDANVYRFNDLVREMAKRSQIIVVTHNKHTMEVVGKLYGVTMQEKGVSTMVSVSLQEVRNT